LPGSGFANVSAFGYLSGKQTSMRLEMATGHASGRWEHEILCLEIVIV
jgi:hypothetical protein